MVFGILLKKIENKLTDSDKTSGMIQQLENQDDNMGVQDDNMGVQDDNMGVQDDIIEKFSINKNQEDEMLKEMLKFTNEERELLKKNGLETSTILLTAIKQIDLPVSELTESGKVLRLGLLNVVKETLEYQKDSVFKMLESQPFFNVGVDKYQQEKQNSIDIENSKSAFKMFQNFVDLMIMEVKSKEIIECEETDLTVYYVGIVVLMMCLIILAYLYYKNIAFVKAIPKPL
jgi:hypothetical protein